MIDGMDDRGECVPRVCVLRCGLPSCLAWLPAWSGRLGRLRRLSRLSGCGGWLLPIRFDGPIGFRRLSRVARERQQQQQLQATE